MVVRITIRAVIRVMIRVKIRVSAVVCAGVSVRVRKRVEVGFVSINFDDPLEDHPPFCLLYQGWC